MITAWTKHCKTPEEKEQFIESLKRGKWLIDHIKSLVDSNFASCEAVELSPKVYDNPNWEFRQADMNGYKRAVRDFQKLLTLDQE